MIEIKLIEMNMICRRISLLFQGLLFTCVLLPLFPLPEPGSIRHVSREGLYSPGEIIARSAPLFEGFPVPEAKYPVRIYRVRYWSTDFDGSPLEITARLFIPRPPAEGESPAFGDLPASAGLPVLVFGSGTTGISDHCAPSLEVEGSGRWGFGHYQTNMLAYAGQGLIVIFPDYPGFNDPDRSQRYFSKKGEAYTMLDAARAVYNFFKDPPAGIASGGDFPGESTSGAALKITPSEKVFTAGYSQGGHAAMAAADLRETYAPEITIAGMAGYGTTNNVETLLREGPVYAPHIFFSYMEMYGIDEIDPSLYLQRRFSDTLREDVYRMCVDEFQRYYPSDGSMLYTREFHQALYGENLEAAFPSLAARLTENKTGLDGHGTPALIIQGLQDTVVSTAAQDLFVRELRAGGSPVRYITMDRVWHRHTRPAGFRETLAWIGHVSGGYPPPNDDIRK